MGEKHRHPRQQAWGWALLAMAVPLLWGIAAGRLHVPLDDANFLLWHTALELVAVLVALLIFATGYHALLSAREGAVVLLAIGFLGVAAFDFLHALSYAGLPDLVTPNTPNKSMLFWLSARLLAAAVLLAYAAWPARLVVPPQRKWMALAAVALLVAGVAGIGLWRPEAGPALFEAGRGLTPLKIGLEWLVVALHLATLAVLWRRREALQQECVMALAFAVALSAVSELFFTLLGRVDRDLANGLGHLYKLAAYFFLGHATFHESLRRPLQRLQDQHRREAAVLDAAPDGVVWVAEDGSILMANPAMRALSGYAPQALLGRHVSLLMPDGVDQRHGLAMSDFFHAPRPRAMGGMDLALRRSDGTMLPVDISLGYHEAHGRKFAIAYIRDLSERKRMEQSLRHQATHDELTSLPNRWLFQLQLRQALTRGERLGRSVGVLFLDLDHFKAINDTYGHATGDELLQQTAARLRSQLRENDVLARLGGDEFAVLLTDLESPGEAAQVAAKLVTAMQAPFRLQQHEVHSGASLGMAFFPEDAQDSETLLRFADMAMYQAKQSGRGTYAYYAPDLDRRAKQDLELHARLKEAIDRGLLELHYQPQLAVTDGAVLGAEALLRWNDPVLGTVAPARFIAVAESTGLIHALSNWVLDEACRQIAAWSRAGRPLRVAINVSAQQFRERDWHAQVAKALERAGAQARWLGIEITESVAMTHPEQASEQLRALAALGCSIALDDFGTGHSSLAYLKSLPVDTLKIDRGFVEGLPQDAGSAAVVHAIVALAHSLGQRLVAEGVETDAQLAFLRGCGCEAFQGFLVASAMPAALLEAFIAARTPHQDIEP